jgi:hypothetical protein
MILKNAFICCTPFHIIVSTHLANTLYKDDDNVIFISDHFKGAENIYEKVKKVTLFNDSYFIKDKEISYDKSNFRINKIIKFINRDANEFIHGWTGEDFDNLFVFTHSFFSLLITDVLKERNPKLKVNFVEEGIMTYIFNIYSSINIFKKMTDTFLKVAFKRRILNINMADSILLFKPELYSGNKTTKITKIPPIKDTEILPILNELFQYKAQSDFSNSNYIFFDQSFTTDNNKLINEFTVMRDLVKIFKSNLLVKLHPRESKSKYLDFNIMYRNNSNFPWEVIYMNEDVKNNVLIAVNSSALFTSQIMFDNYQEIILLNKLYGLSDKKFEKFLKKFKKIVINNRIGVYQPSNLIELESLYNKINKLGGNDV